MFIDSVPERRTDGPTMNDRFFQDPYPKETRQQHFEEMRADAIANDKAVRKTNVRMGTYTGWKPRVAAR